RHRKRKAIVIREPAARNCGWRKEFEAASDLGPQTSASLTGIGLAEIGEPKSGAAGKFSSGKPAGAPARAEMAVPGLKGSGWKADREPRAKGDVGPQTSDLSKIG